MKTHKKGSLLQNLQKTVLAHELWGDNQYLRSLRPRTALQWHRACYFLFGTILTCGAQFLFGEHKQWLGGSAPACSPRRRVCCKFTAIYRTVTIAFSLKRYCSKSVLLKKWELFEVTKRCPNLFPQFPLFAKIRFNSFDSVRLSTLHSQFCDITKGIILQKFLQTKKRDY